MKFTARTILHVVAAVFGAMAIIFAIGAWRLSSGPLSLGFLSPYLEEAFQEEDLPYKIEFEDTILTWAGWDRSLDIHVVNMRVAGTNGETLATAPEVSLGLSGSALLRGVVAPTSVELLGPRMRMIRGHDGQLRFAVGSEQVSDDSGFDALIADLLHPPNEDHPLAGLERVSVLDAVLTVDDEPSGLTWQAPDADLIFDLDSAGIIGQITLSATAKDVAAHFDAITYYDRSTKLTTVSLGFSGLSPAELATLSPKAEDFAGVDLPLAGTVSFGMTPEGGIDGADFDISADAGTITLPQVFPAPVSVVRFKVVGNVNASFDRLALQSFEVVTDGPQFNLKGVIEQSTAGVGVRADFHAVNMPFNSLGDYWPEGVMSDGRSWILLNAKDGVITQFDAALDIQPGEFETGQFREASAVGSFLFEDATINYLYPMPPVKGVAGTARFTGATLDLDMRDGRLTGIAAHRATARLTDIHAETPHIQTIVEASGPALDTLELLDHPRLGLVAKVGLSPDQLSGEVETQFAVDFPLVKEVNVDDVIISAVARVTDASMDGLAGMFDVTEGTLRVSVDTSSMDVRGDAKIQGMPAEIAWREFFDDDAQVASRYDVSMRLTPEGQAALGIDLAPYASGTFDLDLVFTDPVSGPARAAVVLDAKSASLGVPQLFWSKPEGDEGRVQILAEFPADGTIDVGSVDVQAKDFHAVGRATLEEGFAGFRNVVIEQIQNGATDIAAQIDPTADGGVRVSVTGKSLDIRPYLERLVDEGSRDADAFTLELDVDRLITRTNQQLTNARARIVNTAAGLRSGFVEGTLPTGEAFRLFLEPFEGKRRLIVQSGDAGAVARAFDIYDNAVGGLLVLEAILHDDLPGAPISGEVTIEDYHVINAPTLAKILSVATLTGILDSLQGEGISFSTFSMPFTIVEGLLTIEDAKTSGLAIGINAEGTVNLESDEARIRGTIVPAYAVNGIIGNIPLLGDILVGGEGEGVFAATYRVDGPIDEPTVAVNPLAALAPGFLRNLFSFFEGDPSEAEDDGPPDHNPRRLDPSGSGSER
jgi:hypothetical protein